MKTLSIVVLADFNFWTVSLITVVKREKSNSFKRSRMSFGGFRSEAWVVDCAGLGVGWVSLDPHGAGVAGLEGVVGF